MGLFEQGVTGIRRRRGCKALFRTFVRMGLVQNLQTVGSFLCTCGDPLVWLVEISSGWVRSERATLAVGENNRFDYLTYWP